MQCITKPVPPIFNTTPLWSMTYALHFTGICKKAQRANGGPYAHRETACAHCDGCGSPQILPSVCDRTVPSTSCWQPFESLRMRKNEANECKECHAAVYHLKWKLCFLLGRFNFHCFVCLKHSLKMVTLPGSIAKLTFWLLLFCTRPGCASKSPEELK